MAINGDCKAARRLGKGYRAVWRREEKFLCRYEEPKKHALELKIKEKVPENRELDVFAQTGLWEEESDLRMQTEAAARRLSEALLYGKALQNVPLAGAVGGAGDAAIMDRVRRYAAIKYEKRSLLRRRLERE